MLTELIMIYRKSVSSHAFVKSEAPAYIGCDALANLNNLQIGEAVSNSFSQSVIVLSKSDA